MANKFKIVVGQKLWWVPSDAAYSPQGVTVECVGRKWASLSNARRVLLSTLNACDIPHGRCWLSEDDAKAGTDASAAYSRLRNSLGWRPEEGVTQDDILEAARLLRINVEG